MTFRAGFTLALAGVVGQLLFTGAEHSLPALRGHFQTQIPITPGYLSARAPSPSPPHRGSQNKSCAGGHIRYRHTRENHPKPHLRFRACSQAESFQRASLVLRSVCAAPRGDPAHNARVVPQSRTQGQPRSRRAQRPAAKRQRSVRTGATEALLGTGAAGARAGRARDDPPGQRRLVHPPRRVAICVSLAAGCSYAALVRRSIPSKPSCRRRRSTRSTGPLEPPTARST